MHVTEEKQGSRLELRRTCPFDADVAATNCEVLINSPGCGQSAQGKKGPARESSLLHVLPTAATGWLGPWGYTA